MKKFKKALALICCAVLLVCISIGATLAYLTSKTEVAQNTFTYGKVKITLDEADVNEYGEVVSEDRVLQNEYKLMPGHVYTKDPTVTVKADSEESYIRMFVTITDFADVKKVFGDDFLPQDFVNGWNPAIWETTGEILVDEEKNTATYEFRYHETVSTVDAGDKELEPLFTEIKVPEDVVNDELPLLDIMQINVVAYAIQADGFEDADEAWDAYDMNGELPVPVIPTPSPTPEPVVSPNP